MKPSYPNSLRLVVATLLFVTAGAMLLFANLGNLVAAADGDLDPTFGSGGQVITDFFGHSSGAAAIAVQSDGKIVVAGSALSALGPPDLAAVRYNSDGSLDASFGSGGRVTTDFAGRSDTGAAITVQPDGKILVAGSADLVASQFDFALVRYNPNCSLV